ncbi:hypothetical protein [Bacillus sp. V59.32b]|nr:hypothetical protein [Bacillus sp. V59.32b]
MQRIFNKMKIEATVFSVPATKIGEVETKRDIQATNLAVATK